MLIKENWIKHPVILSGDIVELIPLEAKHFDELYIAASDAELWKFIPSDCSVKEKFLSAYSFAIAEREKGNHYPFVIYHKETKKLIGSTRLFDMVEPDKKLEIGWTWIVKEHWGTKVNFECKLLLLTFCFEKLKAIRVQLKTDQNNIRSRTAIEKIGAKFEGILRKDKIKDNSIPRSSAYYSILDEEWEIVRSDLLSKLEK
ncbi:GNAT family protein [soil metagenome]